MSRGPRSDHPGSIHHVINRGVDRQRIFFADVDRVEFGRLVAQVHERFDVTILAYCLMDNHFHLVVRCGDVGLSSAMQHLQGVFATHVNERLERDGHLFRGRFYSAPITDDSYLLTVIRYVERNSLDLAGVDRPSDYRWSSHRRHLGFRDPTPWLDTEFVLGVFGGREPYRRSVARSDTSCEPATIRGPHVLPLASLAVESHVADDVNSAQLERTVAAALIPELTRPNQETLATTLGFSTRRRAMQAANRAVSRLRHQPSIAHARDDFRRLLFEVSADASNRRIA